MEPRTGLRALTALALSVALAPRVADAQFGSGASFVPPPGMASGVGSSPGVGANPGLNPYVNPYLNPYLGQFPDSPGVAAMMFLGASQANGWIGSGRLSGVHPAANAPARVTRARTRLSDVPGAGAARYFNRGPQPHRPPDPHYSRVGSYYPNNAR